MNAIKTVVKDVSKTVANIVGSVGTISTTISGELVKGTENIAHAITSTPGVIGAIITSPVAASVGYVQEDRGITQEEAAKVVADALPDSVKEAIEQGSAATGRALAAMMSEEDDTANSEAELMKLTKRELVAQIKAA